jgi:hypothetical protein
VEDEEQAEQMEHDAERMEHDSERVGDHIDEARQEWEAKEQDPSVPGAQPDPDEEQKPVAGVEADEEETATGNPDAAGAEEPDSGDDE